MAAVATASSGRVADDEVPPEVPEGADGPADGGQAAVTMPPRAAVLDGPVGAGCRELGPHERR